MSAQDKRPSDASIGAKTSAKAASNPSSQRKSVAAIFADQGSAERAVDKLVQEGFDRQSIEVKPAPGAAPSAAAGALTEGRVMVVVAADRAVAALEILVNAGGDTHINQTDNLADAGNP